MQSWVHGALYYKLDLWVGRNFYKMFLVRKNILDGVFMGKDIQIFRFIVQIKSREK